MKMKKGLLSVVFLLATSSAMAAMSFSSAAVTADATYSVKNTDESLLALIGNPYHSATENLNVHGELVLNLDKGFNKKAFGVQEESVYSWNNIFYIKNNSENTIKATVYAKGSDTVSLSSLEYDTASKELKALADLDKNNLEILNGFGIGESTYTIPAGGQVGVDLTLLNYKGGFENNKKVDIIVKAVK
ncbi:hypothetical protein [Psychrobacillus sp. L4]|uniref:hypothetical protein n=1 Tax=Psychrobacillus sp. L4 TaxID=3236892 RepID=UPI0036F3AE9B